jgi:hypothetical protein
MAPRKKRAAADKSAFAERLQAEAIAPAKAILVPDGIDTDWKPVGEPHVPPAYVTGAFVDATGAPIKQITLLKGPTTSGIPEEKQAKVDQGCRFHVGHGPQNMRNDPLSVFINTMNFWGLMATGWCCNRASIVGIGLILEADVHYWVGFLSGAVILSFLWSEISR